MKVRLKEDVKIAGKLCKAGDAVNLHHATARSLVAHGKAELLPQAVVPPRAKPVTPPEVKDVKPEPKEEPKPEPKSKAKASKSKSKAKKK